MRIWLSDCVCHWVCLHTSGPLTSDAWWKYDGRGLWLPVRGGHLLVHLHFGVFLCMFIFCSLGFTCNMTTWPMWVHCAYLRAVFSFNFDNLPKRDEKRRCVFVCVFVCTLRLPTGGRNYSHSASVFRRGCLCCFVSFDSPMCDGNMITCVWFSLCVARALWLQRFKDLTHPNAWWKYDGVCVLCTCLCVFVSVFWLPNVWRRVCCPIVSVY